MSLFKRAAVRGVAHELVRRGIISFPSKEAMDEAADAVADSPAAAPMPEMSPEGGHSPEELAAVANKLMEIAQALMEQAGASGGPPPMGPEGAPAGDAPPPPNPEAAKAAADLTKTASEADYEKLAKDVAVEVMTKAAEEVKAATSGALIMGGDKGNDASQAANVGEVAALDKKQRPEGAYHHGVGKTQLDTMKGHIGDLSKNPEGPHNSPSGSNSVSKDAGGSKAAELDGELKKIANKLVGLHDGKDKNKLTDAAKIDTMAALDNKNRPQGKYHVGQGNANIKEDAAARIGKEMPHPNGPKNSPSGTNSVIEASKVSSEDEAFLLLFKKTAEDVGQYLPAALNDDEKVAAIKRMIGYDHDGRQAYITELHTKTAAAAEGMKGDESKHGKDVDHSKYKTDPAHKDEIGGAQKKESALMGQIREIASNATKPAAAAAS